MRAINCNTMLTPLEKNPFHELTPPPPSGLLLVLLMTRSLKLASHVEPVVGSARAYLSKCPCLAGCQTSLVQKYVGYDSIIYDASHIVLRTFGSVMVCSFVLTASEDLEAMATASDLKAKSTPWLAKV